MKHIFNWRTVIQWNICDCKNVKLETSKAFSSYVQNPLSPLLQSVLSPGISLSVWWCLEEHPSSRIRPSPSGPTGSSPSTSGWYEAFGTGAHLFDKPRFLGLLAVQIVELLTIERRKIIDDQYPGALRMALEQNHGSELLLLISQKKIHGAKGEQVQSRKLMLAAIILDCGNGGGWRC